MATHAPATSVNHAANATAPQEGRQDLCRQGWFASGMIAASKAAAWRAAALPRGEGSSFLTRKA
jgi:hypothetical protein